MPEQPPIEVVVADCSACGWLVRLIPAGKGRIERLLDEQRDALHAPDPSIAGINIGINAGEAAGQTIFHCHDHLIPRRPRDVENPRGRVRHVIPGRGAY